MLNFFPKKISWLSDPGVNMFARLDIEIHKFILHNARHDFHRLH